MVRRNHPRRVITAVAAALTLALVASGCGSRLSEQDRAQALSAGGQVTATGAPTGGNGTAAPVTNGTGTPQGTGKNGNATPTDSSVAPGTQGSGGGTGQTPTGDTGSSGSGTPTTPGQTGGPTPSTPSGSGSGTDDTQVAAPSDPNNPTPTQPGAPQPGTPQQPGAPTQCVPSNGGEVGVTKTEVKVGNVSTMSGPVPGFGETGVAAVRAYFNMVNAEGGVCGRKLTLLTGDDRLQAASNRSETEKLASQVIGFTGNTTVVDDGGTPIINEQKIPDASLSISEQRIESPYNYSPQPIDLSGKSIAASKILAHMHDTYGASRGAIVYPEQASAKARALEYRGAMEKAGIEVVAEYSVAVTETNYSSQVNDMRNNDVDIVITALEVNGMARLAQAFDQARWFPEVPFYGAQVYGQKFLEIAGSAAEGTLVGINYAIPEDRDSNPAIAKMYEWYTKSNPGLDLDFFAIVGWIAADMFVTALKATGPNPTRDSLNAALKGLGTYDGGGIVGNINPGAKTPAQCFMVATVEGGQWRREFPDSGFQC